MGAWTYVRICLSEQVCVQSTAILPCEQGSLMPQQPPARRKTQLTETPVSIPDKLYFRIGDVARLSGLQAYVLRFWETEFPQLKPNKGGTGQRLYRKRDVELVLEIKRLLYDEGFTIAGARRLLAEKRNHEADLNNAVAQAVDHMPASQGEEPAENDRPVHAPATNSEPNYSDMQENAGVEKSPALDSNHPLQVYAALNQVRREVRELLDILRTGTLKGCVVSDRPRRESRKSEISLDVPTLFS